MAPKRQNVSGGMESKKENTHIEKLFWRWDTWGHKDLNVDYFLITSELKMKKAA